MASEPLPPWLKKRRRVPSWLIAVIAFVAVIAAFILYCVIADIVYSRRIEAELEAIRKAGFPVTPAELNAWYARPAGENAAVVYRQAFAALPAFDPKYSELPIVGGGRLPEQGQPLSDDVLKGISDCLADHAKALALAHKAALIGECRFDVDFTNPNESSAYLGHIRWLAKLLRAEALAKAQQGDAVGATNSLCALLGLAHALAEDPTPSSQWLFRHLADREALDTLERIIGTTRFSDAQLADLCVALNSEETSIDHGFLRAMAAARCFGNEWFNHPVEENVDRFVIADRPRLSLLVTSVPVPAWWFARRITGLLAADRLDYLRKMRQMIEARQLPTPQRVGAMEPVWGAIEEDAKHNRMRLGTWIVLPVLGWEDEQATDLLAQMRAARVALAVERYRLANGKLPDAVQELAPNYLDSLPLDPYDGKLIRVRALEKGFVAYSIGKDRKDNGGKANTETHEYDVTFTIER